ncbi:hypothetical protein CVCC1112_1882 [Paenarthrobacter nicotinovorans]|nr:hypothetical protein CVCC1112_1882 [Paenarthrobacter nicotinovorans]
MPVRLRLLHESSLQSWPNPTQLSRTRPVKGGSPRVAAWAP